MGYSTRFIVTQSLGRTQLDQVATQAGFEIVDGAKSLINITSRKTDLGGVNTVADSVMFDGLMEIMKNQSDDTPFFIGLYNYETHNGVKLFDNHASYMGTSEHSIEPNFILDTFHNYDRQFGRFWNYFKNSKWVDNTVVILTSDHATFPSKQFINMLNQAKVSNFSSIFVDEIPFLIYHPDLALQSEYDANKSTSVDFAPTLLNLIGYNKYEAPFLGDSIFSQRTKSPLQNMTGSGTRGWFKNVSYGNWLNVSEGNYESLQETHPLKVTQWKFIRYTESLERANRLVPKEEIIGESVSYE